MEANKNKRGKKISTILWIKKKYNKVIIIIEIIK